LHGAGQGHFGLGCFLPFWIRTLKSLAFVVLRVLLFFVFGLRTLLGSFTLGHPWLSCCGVSLRENRSIGRATRLGNINSHSAALRSPKGQCSRVAARQWRVEHPGDLGQAGLGNLAVAGARFSRVDWNEPAWVVDTSELMDCAKGAWVRHAAASNQCDLPRP
jgi:hypothetical protein